MKKVIVIGIIILFAGSGMGITLETASEYNKQLTNNFTDFDLSTSFSNETYSDTEVLKDSIIESQKSNGDIYPIHIKSNESIYIVKVTSPSEFYLNNFYYTHGWNVITDKPISTTRYRYCFLINETELQTLKGIGLEGYSEQGSIRYLHIKLGKLKLTKDTRELSNMNGSNWTDRMTYKNPKLIPPGTWYFVFVGTIFDLDQDEVLSKISLWMNLSGANLDISTSEGGVVYGVWFGEFDANLIFSRAYEFETMFGGVKQFTIKDTFLYKVTLIKPRNQGFWKMKWITPSGHKKMISFFIDGMRYGNRENYDNCISGIGKSGEYKLTTGYIDYITKGIISASSIYLLCLDIKLF
jgi:hypothetical protein